MRTDIPVVRMVFKARKSHACSLAAVLQKCNCQVTLLGQPSQLHDTDKPGSAQMSAWRLAIDTADFG